MYIQNLKLSFRQISKNKIDSGINILGLALGIACCLIIFLYVHHELNYDKFYPDKERIYRAYINLQEENTNRINFPHALYNNICENIPDIEEYTACYPYGVQVYYGQHVFKEELFMYTDSSMFNIFNWKVKRGSPENLLDHEFDIIITEKAAKKYFGNEDPIGKILRLDNRVDYTVSAIIENIPEQSHVQGDYFVNIASCTSLHPQYGGVWGSNIFIKIKQGTFPSDVEDKLTQNWHNINPESEFFQQSHIKLQPLTKVYLNVDGMGAPSQFKTGSYFGIIFFSLIGLLILLIACFNYLNLTIAKLYARWNEMGVRKSNGANRKILINQIMTENAVNIFIALIFGVIIVIMVLPLINNIIHKTLVLLSVWHSLLGFIAGLFVFILLSTAFYPAYVLSRLNTSEIINQRYNNISGRNGNRGFSRLRGTLISFQFAIVILICICNIIVVKQLFFLSRFDLGFDKESVLVIKNPWDENQQSRYEIMCQLASQESEVDMVSGGYDVPVQGTRNTCGLYDVNDPDNSIRAGMSSVDYDYLSLLNVPFLMGRNFSPNHPTDSLAVILTQDAVELLGLQDPLNSYVSGLWDNRVRPVIGVVDEMVFNSTREDRLPMVFECRQTRRPYCNKIIVKLNSNNITSVRNKLHKIWNENFPGIAFVNYTFNEQMDANHSRELQLKKLIFVFTSISIALCVMGLLGIVLIYTRRKSKEIGIRKVNGAKIYHILSLINKDYVIWMIISFLIASPIAVYLMKKWLQNFSYQTKINVWIFLLALGIILLITIVTVSLQSWRTASRNPVEALRYE